MEGHEVITLREMLRNHINESNNFRSEIKASLAAIEVHAEYTKKTIDDHGDKIGDLKDSQSKQKGALWAAMTIGVAALVKIIKDIFS